MKTNHPVLFTIILLIGFSSAHSQDSGGYKYTLSKSNNTEINIGVADIFAKPYFVYYDIYYNIPTYPTYNANIPGIVLGMKFHNQKGAFRLSNKFSYQKRHSEDPDNSDYNYSDTKILSTSFYAGYEWHSIFNLITIYYGADLLYGYEKYNNEGKQFTDLYENTTSINKYGVTPFIGVNYFITSKVSVGTEFKVNFITFSGKEKYYSESYDGLGNHYTSESKTNETGTDIYFGPLGFLSLNIYF